MAQIKTKQADSPPQPVQEPSRSLVETPGTLSRPIKMPPPAWQQQLKRCADAVASPLSAMSAAIGLHGFTPLPLDQEFARAAAVLDSLCIPNETAAGSKLLKSKARQSETIPPAVLKSAVGILILTSGRLGLRRVSGSTGAGVLLVRDTDSNSWYAPLGIRSYGAGAGPFAFGFEVTDRVYILSSHEAMQRFVNAGFLIGPEALFAAGRLGRGGGVTFAGSLGGRNASGSEANAGVPYECPQCGHQQMHPVAASGSSDQEGTGNVDGGIRESLRNPIQCYMRSMGLYIGLQAEAMVLEERTQDNIDFYGRQVSIIRGPTPLGDVEANLGEEKLASLKVLWDAVSRAESRQEREKLE